MNPLARLRAFLGLRPEAAPAAASTAAAPAPALISVSAVGEALAPPPSATGPRGVAGRESRAWRNRNPGNLRPPSRWTPDGLAGIDRNPGGPFCVFGSEIHGWQALATRLLQMHAAGLDTVAEIIPVWAPASDSNDTPAYVAGVCRAIGVGPHDLLDIGSAAVMRALCDAIRRHEGKATDPPWPRDAQDRGIAIAYAARRK
jgi:hypothetical protein